MNIRALIGKNKKPKIPKEAVLACSCGTYWKQRDIDEYNNGDFERALSRHQSLWKPDGKTHDVQPIT